MNNPFFRELKLVFAGPMGAGKTTAIAALSDIEPLRTEATNTDLLQSAKSTTTVALDYGELTLESGEKLKLFGTPGQKRFEFMWQHVAQGALGLIVLLDCSRPDPLGDLMDCISGFPELASSNKLIVGLGRSESLSHGLRLNIVNALSDRGIECPVVSVDVRKRSDVLLLVDVLLQLLDVAGQLEP